MAFKLQSKNTLSIIIFLLTIILLSESKILYFFFNNALGRAIFIILLIFVSYLNKILGVVIVFFVIIMFNSNIQIVEGFDGTKENKNILQKQIKEKIKQNLQNPQNPQNNNFEEGEPPSSTFIASDSTETTPPTTETIQPTTETIQPTTETTPPTTEMPPMIPTSNADETTTHTEGFDILGIERTIQKGKKSNSILIDSDIRNSNSVIPYDNSSFSENFTIY